ncbi:MAG: lytic transglycosylase domain-containing protein [Proteobacteria bacterium]|nr:lytic transglycosylase domain-containing protein [Pseudomonadota bacterium]
MTFRTAFAALSVAALVAPANATAQPRILALSAHDDALYRQAFDAIDAHNWHGVTSALAHVDDNSLAETVRGRMLASPAYRASYGTLAQWLAQHGELAVAQAVYERAQDTRPHRGRGRRRHAIGAPPPEPDPFMRRTLPGTPPDIVGDTSYARSQISDLAERVGNGDDTGARAIGAEQLSGPRAGQAAWWLGLLAYRSHDYAEAVRQFEAAAQWPYFGGWASAGAHYWAARARLATGDSHGVADHLEAAARRPWTFYGQLAEAQLGRGSALDFTPPQMDATALRLFIDAHPEARRAAMLAQLGRLSEVEGELRRLHGSLQQHDDHSFLALAVALQAPAAQLRAAEYGGPAEAAGFCPDTTFEPTGGFALDRALVYAIVRQESYFNPTARSYSNARGLMQLLPSTARDMDNSVNYRRVPTALSDPNRNLSIGQDYVQWLMDEFHSDRDLARVFASYNGGPGWLSRWLATQPADIDPLLMLETMPREQSRDYAERVLSHMALCRKRYGQEPAELDAMAAGRPAIYQPQDHAASNAPTSTAR